MKHAMGRILCMLACGLLITSVVFVTPPTETEQDGMAVPDTISIENVPQAEPESTIKKVVEDEVTIKGFEGTVIRTTTYENGDAYFENVVNGEVTGAYYIDRDKDIIIGQYYDENNQVNLSTTVFDRTGSVVTSEEYDGIVVTP